MDDIRQINYRGQRAVELRTRGLRLITLASRGPRIAHLGLPDGGNLLFWAPGKHRRGAWDLMGGHRVWVTRPGADEAEETYSPDNQSCSVEIRRGGFSVTAAEDRNAKLVRRLTVRVLSSDRLHVQHSVTNTSDMLWSGGLWGLTCTLPTPDTTYVVPLSDGSKWDTASVTLFRQWGGGHAGSYDDPQFTYSAESALVKSLGRENKRAYRTAAGIIALHDPSRDVLFAKCTPYQRGATYPLDSNLALYTGEKSFMVEMESMSPVATLKPGETLSHVETWCLTPAKPAVPSAAQLRRLFA